MRITHLCLGCFFPDGYSYQENMLPKYHKKLGHDVSVVASLQTFDKNGNVSYMDKASEYRNEYGIPPTDTASGTGSPDPRSLRFPIVRGP